MSRSPLNCHQLRKHREKEARLKAYTDRFNPTDLKELAEMLSKEWKENNKSRHSTRSPSATPSPIFSQASSRKAKSPLTPLSSPLSGEEIKGIETAHCSRKRKTIDEDVETPITKRVKHKATTHDEVSQVQKPSVSKTKSSNSKRRGIRARRRRDARGGERFTTLPEGKAGSTASREPDPHEVPSTPSAQDPEKDPAVSYELSIGEKHNALQNCRKRNINCTDDIADEHEAKKVKLDNQLDEKAGLDHIHPSASVDTATSTETRREVVADKEEPGDANAQTMGTVAESATSSGAEQKARISQDGPEETDKIAENHKEVVSSETEHKAYSTQGALEETATIAPDQQEATSSDTEQNAHSTQGALEETGPTKETRQGPDTPPSPPVSYNGLFNHAQMCYQNATYQCLLSLEGLIEHLDELPWPEDVMPYLARIVSNAKGKGRAKFRKQLSRSRSLLLITPPIINIFQGLRQPQGRNIVTASLTADFIACIRRDEDKEQDEEIYDGYSQQDAAGFLSFLIDRLEKEEQMFSQVDTLETTNVHKLFRGEMKEMFRCSECGHTIEKSQEFRSLSVNLPSTQDSEVQSASLETLINTSFEDEDISGYKCDHCGQIDLTRKSTKLSCLPPYLVVALNRSEMVQYEDGELGFEKNRTRVLMTSEHLDLSDLCDPLWLSGDEMYSLCGFVRHIGGSTLKEGHYQAVCKGQDGVWRLFDDDEVSRLTYAQVQIGVQGAQTLFFEKN